MNIFIDSNILYKDPFLTKGFNKALNRLARHNDVKLFISKAVYMEVLRGHKDFLQKQLKTINEIQTKLSPYLLQHKQNFIVDIKLEDLLQDFANQYQQLQKEEQLIVIDFDKDVLNFIVEIDMYEKSPFIKTNKIHTKGGDIINFNKKEIRDAIIWYSYQIFIQKNNLKDCHFISNNTNEFGNENAKKSPENKPYTLHPELSTHISITPYKSVKGFLTHNDEQVKKLFKDIHPLILSEEFSDKIKEELENGFAEKLINKYFIEQILVETQDFLFTKQPDDIHEDYFMGGDICPLYGNITNIQFYDLDIYGEELIIVLDVEVNADVEIFLYNPAYGDSEKKYQYYATDTIKVEESVVFVIPLNTEKELNKETFSLENYMGDVPPKNWSIEIIQYENIYHKDMFPESYNYEKVEKRQ